MVKSKKVTTLIVSIVLVLVLSACGGEKKSSDDSVEIVLSWWTNPVRTEMTKEAVELFEEQNPNIKVKLQYSGWNEYWEKLATNAVGGGLPDVMQMDGSRIQQYVDKDQLMDLSTLDIDTSKLSDVAVESGKIGDELFALMTSVNAQMFIYDQEVLDEAGVEFPEGNYTWEDFIEIGEQINDKTGKYLIANEGQQTALLSYFLRTKDETLYSEDGKTIGASAETIAEWFQLWLDMQEKGIVPSAEKSQSYDHDDHPSNPLVNEEAAFAWLLLGTEPEFEQHLGKSLEKAFLPEWGSEKKPYDVHGAMFWAMSSNTKYPEEAAKLIDFLENSPEVAEIFGTDRGIPANEDNMEIVVDIAEDHHVEEQVEFMETVEEVSSPTVMEPAATNEISDLVKNLAEQTQAKQKTPLEAAEELIERGNEYLSK